MSLFLGARRSFTVPLFHSFHHLVSSFSSGSGRLTRFPAESGTKLACDRNSNAAVARNVGQRPTGQAGSRATDALLSDEVELWSALAGWMDGDRGSVMAMSPVAGGEAFSQTAS